MTADEIRRLGSRGQLDVADWNGTIESYKEALLREIAAQLAEQNVHSRAIIELWGDAKKRDEDNIARVAKLDEDLHKARLATEAITQKYWQLAAKVEEAKADLWKPLKAASQPSDAGKENG